MASFELDGVILVYSCHCEESVCKFTKRKSLPPVFSEEIFEIEWLWMASSEQFKIAACSVIQFPTTKIFFCILL